MHRLRSLFFHGWFFEIQSDTDQTRRPTQDRFHLSVGYIRLSEYAFWSENAGATFQRTMSFAFHDLKHIVEAYLDDLASRSRKRVDHPTHLRLIFE